jgi:hypothetical protein
MKICHLTKNFIIIFSRLIHKCTNKKTGDAKRHIQCQACNLLTLNMYVLLTNISIMTYLKCEAIEWKRQDTFETNQ